MMIRVNEVSETKSAEANESAVKSRNSLTADEPLPASWSEKRGLGGAREEERDHAILPLRPCASLRRSS